MKIPDPRGEPVEFTCPFCQTPECVAYANAVIHPLTKPMCIKYMMLEPDEFIRAVNDSILVS